MQVTRSLAVSERDHAQGRRDAPVTLIEYGDYQCSHCARAHPIVRAVQLHLGAALRFVYRYFPLQQLHPQARAAAYAAEAAAAQGKFWEMHDSLFVHQAALEAGDLRRYAQSLSLDVERWERDIASLAHAARVDEDLATGIENGVDGTPTFFINGQRYVGPTEERGLLLAIQNAIHARAHAAG